MFFRTHKVRVHRSWVWRENKKYGQQSTGCHLSFVFRYCDFITFRILIYLACLPAYGLSIYPYLSFYFKRVLMNPGMASSSDMNSIELLILLTPCLCAGIIGICHHKSLILFLAQIFLFLAHISEYVKKYRFLLHINKNICRFYRISVMSVC